MRVGYVAAILVLQIGAAPSAQQLHIMPAVHADEPASPQPPSVQLVQNFRIEWPPPVREGGLSVTVEDRRTSINNLDLPSWLASAKVKRSFFRRGELSATVTLAHGVAFDGPQFRELESGTPVVTSGALTGPGTYSTDLSTRLMFTFDVKSTGRVRMKMVGELWNPLGVVGPRPILEQDSPFQRALKAGLITTF